MTEERWKPDSLVTIPASPSLEELELAQKECEDRISLALEMRTVKITQKAIEKAMRTNREGNG